MSMHIAYYDESGDDGYPEYSSPLFVLSSCYMHYLNWRESWDAIHDFRKELKELFGFPVKMEMHTKEFLLNKRPYRKLGISEEDRVEIVGKFCEFVPNLNLKFVNVAIVKPPIYKNDYKVLETAFTYSIQRIENDLDPMKNPTHRFLIITDEGRVGAMTRTARKIQRYNYIPSKFDFTCYRSEIRSLIEDPLPKNSRESYFIQLCDLVAFIVYLYVLRKRNVGKFHNRMPGAVNQELVGEWLEKLRPRLNLEASPGDDFGVADYPK